MNVFTLTIAPCMRDVSDAINEGLTYYMYTIHTGTVFKLKNILTNSIVDMAA